MKRDINVLILVVMAVAALVISGCSSIIIQACTDDGRCTDFERMNGCDDCQIDVPQDWCTDSDSQNNPYFKGFVETQDGRFYDKCGTGSASAMLHQQECNGNQHYERNGIVCEDGCSDGACQDLTVQSCSDYTYSSCPQSCQKQCISTTCNADGVCTSDCDGAGSCFEIQNNIVSVSVLDSSNGEVVSGSVDKAFSLFVELTDVTVYDLEITLPESCWIINWPPENKVWILEPSSLDERSFGSFMCLDGTHNIGIRAINDTYETDIIFSDYGYVVVDVESDTSELAGLSCQPGQCVVKTSTGLRLCQWPISVNEVGVEVDSVSYTMETADDVQNQVRFDAMGPGLAAFQEGLGLTWEIPLQDQCGGNYACSSGTTDDGLACSSAGSNIFGAGECFAAVIDPPVCITTPCDFEEEIVWQCEHKNMPNEGCTGEPISTADGYTEEEALNMARESAAQACCPCNDLGTLHIDDGSAWDKGADYKGYACRC